MPTRSDVLYHCHLDPSYSHERPRAGWPAVRGLAGTRPGGAARLAAMRISRHAALHCGRVRAAALANTGVPEGHGSSASGVERSDPGERGEITHCLESASRTDRTAWRDRGTRTGRHSTATTWAGRFQPRSQQPPLGFGARWGRTMTGRSRPLPGRSHPARSRSATSGWCVSAGKQRSRSCPKARGDRHRGTRGCAHRWPRPLARSRRHHARRFVRGLHVPCPATDPYRCNLLPRRAFQSGLGYGRLG